MLEALGLFIFGALIVIAIIGTIIVTLAIILFVCWLLAGFIMMD